MHHKRNHFQSFRLFSTAEDKRKQEFQKYEEQIAIFRSMDAEILEVEYINAKTRWEQRKRVLAVLLIMAVLALAMGVWKQFFVFVETCVFFLMVLAGREIDTAAIGLVCACIATAVLALGMLSVITIYMADLRRLQKKLFVLEMIRREKA